MTLALRTALADALTDAMTASHPTWDVETTQNAVTERTGQWVRLTVLDGGEHLAAIGGATNLYRQPVLAYVDIFDDLGAGDGAVLAVEATVKAALRNLTASDARWHTFAAGPEGQDGTRYRKQIIATFRRSFRA